MDQFNIKPNSHKYKEEQRASSEEKKKLEKVVVGSTKTKKKSGFNKFMNELIPSEKGSIKNYIFEDVLIPTVKKTISGVVDMLLYGHSRKNGAPATKVSYRSFFDDPRPRVDERPKIGYSYDDVIFDSRGDADLVLSQMNDIIDTYGMVSVADLYELADISSNYTDHRYGWVNLRSAEIIRGREGYELRLPRPQPIK